MKHRLISVILILALLCFPLPARIEAASVPAGPSEDAPCEHEYEPEVVPPACTEDGFTRYTCVKCGDSYEDDFTYALLHDWPKDGTVTQAPTETGRGVLTFTCARCGATKDRPLAAGNEKAHREEILFISDLHSGRNAENGYHNLRAMFRLLRENDDFIPEVVAGGGDYLESRTYDDADWPHSFEVLHDIMYETSPDTVQALTAGNHDWEWSRQSEETLEKLLGFPRVCNSYSGDDFELFQIGAHKNGSDQEEFLEEDIAKLRVFLDSMAGSGKLIFIQTHWPLHYGYNGSNRSTKNADLMIELLNEYAAQLDICFVWGHNHNQDAMRHKVLVSGDELRITKKEYRTLQFTYVNAGCLNERHAKEGAGPEDSYYGPGYLLEARIRDDTLILDYGHITGAWPDPENAAYDHDADLLYVPDIQEARPSHHEIPLLHRAACDHVFSEETTAATCTEPGLVVRVCAKCGLRTEEALPALGHDLTAHAAAAPTCTEVGWDAYDTCTRCDYTTCKELPALGHDLTAHAAAAPSCTKTGWEAYETCSRCDHSTYKELPALGHDPVTDSAEAASCTQPGRSAGSHCARCGEVFAAQETVPALGHDWGAWTAARTDAEVLWTKGCTRCDAEETNTVQIAALAALIAEAEAADREGTTGEAWANLSAALVEAKRIFDAAEDQTSVDAAAQTLTTALAALQIKLDVTGLLAAIANARALDPDEYTEESAAVLQAALKAAEDALQSRDQTVIYAAADRLNAAIDALERKPFRFADVQDPDAFFFAPVYWAYGHTPQITTGVSDTQFGPGQSCTRAQVVTFLWRAANSPSTAQANNPFGDVSESNYYYNAVLWAVERGITAGTGEGKFSPNAVCTRAQTVTFLWRAAGEPAVGSDIAPQNPFTDVKETAYYYSAVLWAVNAGVTAGTGAGSFSPNAVCTRGQVVTFLYRSCAR